MSVLTQIAAILRTKFNEHTNAINGKEPAINFGGAVNTYFGTDASGVKGQYTLPSGGGLTWADLKSLKEDLYFGKLLNPVKSTEITANNQWRMNWTAYSPTLGIYVTVGGPGSTQTKFAYSYDGVTWVATAALANVEMYVCVIWIPELAKFAALAQSGRIAVSTNGTTWTEYNIGSGTQWKSLTWSPAQSRIVAVGYGVTAYSTDGGATWTAAGNAYNIESVTWSATRGKYLAVGSSGAKVLYSSNGATWTAWNGTNIALGCTFVTWSEGRGQYIALIQNYIYASADETNWALLVTLPTSGTIKTLQWSAYLNLHIAVIARYSNIYSNQIGLSEDGTTWRYYPVLTMYTNANSHNAAFGMYSDSAKKLILLAQDPGSQDSEIFATTKGIF